MTDINNLLYDLYYTNKQHTFKKNKVLKINEIENYINKAKKRRYY